MLFEDSYYEEWFPGMEDGWITGVNFNPMQLKNL